MSVFLAMVALIGLLGLLAIAILMHVHVELGTPDRRLARQIIEHEQFRADQRLQQLTQDALTDMLQTSRPGPAATDTSTVQADGWYRP